MIEDGQFNPPAHKINSVFLDSQNSEPYGAAGSLFTTGRASSEPGVRQNIKTKNSGSNQFSSPAVLNNS